MAQQKPYLTEEYVLKNGFLVLYFAALLVFVSLGFLIAFTFGREEGLGFAKLFLLAGVLIGGVVGLPLIEYVTLRCLGLHPSRQRRDGRGSGSYLISWWEVSGYRFTKGQFILAYGVPTLYWYALLFAYVARFPDAAPAIGFAVPVWIGNIWYLVLAIKKPEGTLTEKLGNGVRFYEPAVLDSRPSASS